MLALVVPYSGGCYGFIYGRTGCFLVVSVVICQVRDVMSVLLVIRKRILSYWSMGLVLLRLLRWEKWAFVLSEPLQFANLVTFVMGGMLNTLYVEFTLIQGTAALVCWWCFSVLWWLVQCHRLLLIAVLSCVWYFNCCDCCAQLFVCVQ